jgi:hypothetical protein
VTGESAPSVPPSQPPTLPRPASLTPAQRELARLLAQMLVAEVRKSADAQAPTEATVWNPFGIRPMSTHVCCEQAQDGTPCGMSPLRKPDPDGRRRCLTHTTLPEGVETRTARNLAGGLNRLRTLPEITKAPDLASIAGLRRALKLYIHAVSIGTLAPEVGRVAILRP